MYNRYNDAYVPVSAFDIVTAPYVDLNGYPKMNQDGTPQRGLFFVVRVDDNVLQCFKITSQESFVNDFSYRLGKDRVPFLLASSYVLFDRWICVFRDQVDVLGSVPHSLRMALLRRFDRAIREVDTSLKDNMPFEELRSRVQQEYVSPNAVRKGGKY